MTAKANKVGLRRYEPKELARVWRRLRRDYGASRYGGPFLDEMEQDTEVHFFAPTAKFVEEFGFTLCYSDGDLVAPLRCRTRNYMHELRHHWQATGPAYIFPPTYRNSQNPRQTILEAAIHEADAWNVMDTFKPAYQGYEIDDFKRNFIQFFNWYITTGYLDRKRPYLQKSMTYPFEKIDWRPIEDRLGVALNKTLPPHLGHIPDDDINFAHLVIQHTCRLPDGRNYFFAGLSPQEQWDQTVALCDVIEKHYGQTFRSLAQFRAANLRLTDQRQPTVTPTL